MLTKVDQIAEGIFRLSTFVPDVAPPHGFTFNQFLIAADQPLLFHCGQKALFPYVSEALATILPLDRLHWISFGHIEADECGAMNLWLAEAPQAQVLFNELGCQLSVNDLADRPPRSLKPDECLDLGGKRIRLIPTPHVPHNWESQVLYEETTRTLFCGDLFTHVGDGEPLIHVDIVGPAVSAEHLFQATSLGPHTSRTIRRLAELEPDRLALMHGSSFVGDGGRALRSLADTYDAMLVKELNRPRD